MAYPIPETEERPPEAKDKHLISKEAPKREGSPGKSVNAAKGSFSDKEDVSQRSDLLAKFMIIVACVENCPKYFV